MYKRRQQKYLSRLYGITGISIVILVLYGTLTIAKWVSSEWLLSAILIFLVSGVAAVTYHVVLFLSQYLKNWMVGGVGTVLFAVVVYSASYFGSHELNLLTGESPEVFSNANTLFTVIMFPKALALLFMFLSTLLLLVTLCFGFLLALRNTIASALEHFPRAARKIPHAFKSRYPAIWEWNFGGKVFGLIAVLVASTLMMGSYDQFEDAKQRWLFSVIELVEFFPRHNCVNLPATMPVAFLGDRVMVVETQASGKKTFRKMECKTSRIGS